MLVRKLFSISLIIFTSAFSYSQTVLKKIDYQEGKEVLQGYFMYEKKFLKSRKLPAVIIIHDRMGLTDFIKRKAEEVASMGYAVFIADIYGKDHQPANVKEAIELTKKFKAGDRALLRQN